MDQTVRIKETKTKIHVESEWNHFIFSVIKQIVKEWGKLRKVVEYDALKLRRTHKEFWDYHAVSKTKEKIKIAQANIEHPFSLKSFFKLLLTC